jgi:hypothetical protein
MESWQEEVIATLSRAIGADLQRYSVEQDELVLYLDPGVNKTTYENIKLFLSLRPGLGPVYGQMKEHLVRVKSKRK